MPKRSNNTVPYTWNSKIKVFMSGSGTTLTTCGVYITVVELVPESGIQVFRK